ncbi:fibronectin type III domain-containing protein [Pseudomonas vancouverensis]|uniref:fibronectin type III domain-containing protein n=1 Tax=Pseudomonas vancouverensis TaxID=95300 RepID=UPI003D014AFA
MNPADRGTSVFQLMIGMENDLHQAVRICAPGNFRVSRTSASTALLSWDEPYAACPICPGALGYEVFGEGVATKSVIRPPCEISGLKADVEYLISVTAKAAGNNVSLPSRVRLFTYKLLAPGKPGVPQLSNLTHAGVTLDWESSTDNGGNLVYEVYLNGCLIKRTAQPQANLAHLRSHTDYRVEVRAVNAAGASEPSVFSFKTRLRTPARLRFSQRNGEGRLAWDPEFRLFPAHEVSINGKKFVTVPGRWWYSFRLSEISSGPLPLHFSFAVAAQLDGARSEESLLEAIVEDDVPPSRPGAPVVSNITNSSATLSWRAVDDVDVTGYRVVMNGLLLFATVDTHFDFKGLTSGVYHFAYVRARDKAGNLSLPSEMAVFKTTGPSPAPRPSAPVANIVPLTSTTVRLEWKYNQDDAPGTGVRILLNDEFLKDVLILDSYRLKDLLPDREYSISISLFDLFGQLSNPTVLLYEPKDLVAPSAPLALQASNATGDTVTLSWEASTDDVGIQEYVIYNNREYFDRTPLLQYKVDGLVEGTYRFEVCALDLSGNASEAAAVTVLVTSDA